MARMPKRKKRASLTPKQREAKRLAKLYRVAPYLADVPAPSPEECDLMERAQFDAEARRHHEAIVLEMARQIREAKGENVVSEEEEKRRNANQKEK